jgi:hypothetical protein
MLDHSTCRYIPGGDGESIWCKTRRNTSTQMAAHRTGAAGNNPARNYPVARDCGKLLPHKKKIQRVLQRQMMKPQSSTLEQSSKGKQQTSRFKPPVKNERNGTQPGNVPGLW